MGILPDDLIDFLSYRPSRTSDAAEYARMGISTCAMTVYQKDDEATAALLGIGKDALPAFDRFFRPVEANDPDVFGFANPRRLPWTFARTAGPEAHGRLLGLSRWAAEHRHSSALDEAIAVSAGLSGYDGARTVWLPEFCRGGHYAPADVLAGLLMGWFQNDRNLVAGCLRPQSAARRITGWRFVISPRCRGCWRGARNSFESIAIKSILDEANSMTNSSILRAVAVVGQGAGATLARPSVSGTVKGQTVEMTLTEGAAQMKMTILENGSFEDDRDGSYQTGGRSVPSSRGPKSCKSARTSSSSSALAYRTR